VFWVVDNYLKEKNWKQRDVRRNMLRADGNETEMKFRPSTHVQGMKYKPVRGADNGSDTEDRLLSMEDDDTGIDAPVSFHPSPSRSGAPLISPGRAQRVRKPSWSSVAPNRTSLNRLEFL